MSEGSCQQTALVVDDDPQMCELLQLLLRDRYTVLTAPSAHAALALVERGRPPVHIVLTDLQLPTVDGAQLAEQLRVRYPGLPVVIMTARLDDGARRAAARAGASALLAKPFDAQELLGALTRR